MLLCDPANNEIEVQVIRKNEKLYLGNGWHQVGRIYQLYEGGWLKVYYYNGIEFVMEIRDRWMIEVKYPEPPQKYSLPIEFTLINSEVKVEEHVVPENNDVSLTECFYYYADKNLKAKTAADYSVVSLYLTWF